MRHLWLVGLLLALTLPACELTCDPGRMKSIEYMNKGVELHRDVSCRTPSQSRLMSFSASSSRDQGHPDALSASRVKAARTIFLVGISRPGEKPGSAAAKEKPASRDPAP